MNFLEKLLRLKTEIGQLLQEGVDKAVMFNYLYKKPLYADIDRTQIHQIYDHLQKETQLKAEIDCKIAERKQLIAECEQQTTDKSKSQVAEYKRQLDELKRVGKYQQSASNHLMYEFNKGYVDFKNIWKDRIFVESTDGIHSWAHVIEVHDMFQNMSKTFLVEKICFLRAVHVLKFPFVLLYETDHSSNNHFCLVQLDFESNTLQIVQRFKRHTYEYQCFILVNSSNPSKFLMRGDGYDIFKCELIDNQVHIGERLALTGLNLYCDNISYFDSQIYKFQCKLGDNDYGERKFIQPKMRICNLEKNDDSTIDLDSTPDNLKCYYGNNSGYSTWVRDRVFIYVKFSFTRKYGIIFTDSQTRRWSILEFAANWKIDKVEYDNGAESLMVRTKEGKDTFKPSNYEIFKIPLRKPNLLRNLAWLKIINAFKKAKVEDLYAKARRYLPLNSDIQPFMFAEN